MSLRGVSVAMAAELESLTEPQRAAVLHDGDVVIKAGPGSGKTRTIVARVGYLLQTQPDPFRGVAAITYTRPAAREIRLRLQRMGLNPGHLLAASTVHAFCLQHILRPFSTIAGGAPIGRSAVIGVRGAGTLWQRIFDSAGIPDKVSKHSIALTVIRRRLASGESVEGQDDRLVRAAAVYEKSLDAQGILDFEAIVSRALQVLRTSPRARESLVARFPHLVVDEYQDLGPVLHQIVLELRQAGAVIAAVGDEDQTILGFTGADSKFLRSLTDEHGFHGVSLGTNFRSGTAIVDASQQALGVERRHRSVADAPLGLVDVRHVSGGYDEHGRVVAQVVSAAINDGVPAHEIAVLYPRAGALLEAVSAMLEAAGVEVRFEKDARLPGGALSDLVQLCAQRLLGTATDPALLSRDALPRQSELHAAWRDLQRQAGAPALDALEARTVLYGVTDGHSAVDPSDPAAPWLREVTEALGLQEIADQSTDDSLSGALAAFQHRDGSLLLRDLVAQAQVPGKVVLTNYHLSKGREFDLVVLPGVIEREVPMWNWDRPPGPLQLASARRELYVAMTRPRHRLLLTTGDWYTDYRGRQVRTSPSRFLADLDGG